MNAVKEVKAVWTLKGVKEMRQMCSRNCEGDDA